MTAAASAADGGIHKKILGLNYRNFSSSASHNNVITLIISNNEMEETIKIVKSLKDSGLLFKEAIKTVQNKVKEQKGGFLSMILGDSMIGGFLSMNISNESWTRNNQSRWETDKVNEKSSRNCKIWLWLSFFELLGFLILPHPLNNFEIQRYYQNESRFNRVFSRDNLSKIRGGAYVTNLDEYSDIGIHWVALYVSNNDVTYFDSFRVEHIPKEIKTFINNKNIKTNIFRIQAYDSIMCGYFCIRFINFMLADKTLTKFTNLFSPNDFNCFWTIVWLMFKMAETKNRYINLLN